MNATSEVAIIFALGCMCGAFFTDWLHYRREQRRREREFHRRIAGWDLHQPPFRNPTQPPADIAFGRACKTTAARTTWPYADRAADELAVRTGMKGEDTN